MEVMVDNQTIAERNDELIRKYRETRDEDTRETFFEENMRLVRHLASKFDNIGDDANERISIGSYGLLKAFNTYNLDAGVKFATYASRVINNELLMHYRHSRKHFGRLINIEDPITRDKDGNALTILDTLKSDDADFEDFNNNELIQQALEALRSKLSEQYFSIFEECFIKGRLQHKVASDLHLSQSYVSRIVKRSTKELHKIGQALLSEPKELKDVGYKTTVRTHKGDLPSAEVNGMIAYLINNTGSSNMVIHKFLGVAYPQVGSVKRRIDSGIVFEHVHPSRHGFNIDDLYKEHTFTVGEEKKVEKHGPVKLEDFDKDINDFADKIVEERFIRREQAIAELDTLKSEDTKQVFHDPTFSDYEKAEAWKTTQADGLSTYVPLPKQAVSEVTISTKGTGQALADIVSNLLRTLDPEKSYKLHLVYEELK